MRDKKREDRRIQIETAAYELLQERGFSSTSMLEIAKRAKASNETLYRWYGDKLGLFGAMVERNAATGLERLKAPLDANEDLSDKLIAFGTALLMGILSERAIILNRVAVSDTSGALGETLARNGRESVTPLLREVIAAIPPGGVFADHDDMTETFLSLLLGDLQSRRLIGRLPAPDLVFCRQRAERATALFDILRQADPR